MEQIFIEYISCTGLISIIYDKHNNSKTSKIVKIIYVITSLGKCDLLPQNKCIYVYMMLR